MLSSLMPEQHSETIALRENRLIEHWEGVALLGCGALLLTGVLLVLRHRRWAWLVCVAGAAALGLAIYAGSGSRLLLLPATPGVQGAVYAVPGLGLVVAGLAALMASVAGLAIALRGRG